MFHPDVKGSPLLRPNKLWGRAVPKAVLSKTSRLFRMMLGRSAPTDSLEKPRIERPEVSLTLPTRPRVNSGGGVHLPEPTEVTIAAIFYNEAEYLKEWIEFHLMVGVDRFFLYDNGSTDNFRSVLEPYLDRQQIVLVQWASFLEDASAQRLAYAHAVCNCPSTVRWLVFIDIDEFLFSEASDDIKTIFANLKNFTALRIPRFEFGPNGHKEKPSGLVIENYTRVSRREFNLKYAWKSAVQPNNVTAIGVHEALVSGEILSIQPNESRRRWSSESITIFLSLKASSKINSADGTVGKPETDLGNVSWRKRTPCSKPLLSLMEANIGCRILWSG